MSVVESVEYLMDACNGIGTVQCHRHDGFTLLTYCLIKMEIAGNTYVFTGFFT